MRTLPAKTFKQIMAVMGSVDKALYKADDKDSVAFQLQDDKPDVYYPTSLPDHIVVERWWRSNMQSNTVRALKRFGIDPELADYVTRNTPVKMVKLSDEFAGRTIDHGSWSQVTAKGGT